MRAKIRTHHASSKNLNLLILIKTEAVREWIVVVHEAKT